MKWVVPELARRIAAERIRCHEHHASSRYMGIPFETAVAGVCGEMHFARCFGLPYTFEQAALQVGGDGGIDFTVPLIGRPNPLTFDIKTARKPTFLFVKKADIGRGAEILVQCKYDDELGPTFVGWEWRSVMKKMRLRYFPKYNQHNYARLAEDLRPMAELCDLLARREVVGGAYEAAAA